MITLVLCAHIFAGVEICCTCGAWCVQRGAEGRRQRCGACRCTLHSKPSAVQRRDGWDVTWAVYGMFNPSCDTDSPLGRLVGTDNLVEFYTRVYNKTPLVVQGSGAGREVTAAGVIADMVDIARSM